MNQATSDILILEEGQELPKEIKYPPRKPKWYDTFKYIANPEQFCRQNLDNYGPIFNTGVFGGETIFVGTAKAIKMVFNGDSNYTEIALPETTMEMFGEYSLFQRPDLHRDRKNALAIGLTGRALEGYIPNINTIILAGLEHWSKIETLPLYSSVEEICFNVLTPLLLGIKLDDNDTAIFSGLPLSTKRELKEVYQTYFNGFYGLLKWKSPLTAYGRGLAARSKLIKFMEAVINKRRQEKNIDPTRDFLSMMLVSQQENPNGVFSDSLIANQCLLQLWASLYEISSLVASVIYQLGKYQEIREKLRLEQTKIIGKYNHHHQFLPEHLRKMSLLEATIKETLRTLPPSSTANRRLTKSVVVDGVLYPKGSTMIAEPRLAHIMPEYFEQPEIFAPERFLPPRNEDQSYQFIPFGGGVHACLGAQMAMTVTKIFISHVLSKFDWQLIGKPSFVQFPLKKIKDNYRIKLVHQR